MGLKVNILEKMVSTVVNLENKKDWSESKMGKLDCTLDCLENSLDY